MKMKVIIIKQILQFQKENQRKIIKGCQKYRKKKEKLFKTWYKNYK